MSSQERDTAGRFARRDRNAAFNDAIRAAGGFGDVPPEFEALSANDKLRVLGGVDVPVPGPAPSTEPPAQGAFGGGHPGIMDAPRQREPAPDDFNARLRLAVRRSRGEEV